MSELKKLIEKLCTGGVPYKKLGEISSFRRGSFPQPYGNREWYDGDGAMPFVQVADIRDDMHLVEETNRKISKLAQKQSVFVPKGTVIVTLQGSIGRVAITDYDCYVDRTIAIFEKLSDEVDKKYFIYQLENIFEIKERTARGSTIKTITKEEFTSFSIPLPPLEVQYEIVRMLDKFKFLSAELATELAKELATRKKQFEYYRNVLLTLKEDVI